MGIMSRRHFLAASGGAALATMGLLSSVRAQGTRRVDRILLPIAGDWDGDRKDGIGAVDTRDMMFHLRNPLSEGPVDYQSFRHGNPRRFHGPYIVGDPACVPIVGDWDGDGKDGIGIVYLDSMTFYLRNSLSEGPVDYPPFRHGNATGNCVPIVGDWDGDGKDGIGIVYLDTMMFWLRNPLSEGPPSYPPFPHGGPNPPSVPRPRPHGGR
jgi:hypothetical protein